VNEAIECPAFPEGDDESGSGSQGLEARLRRLEEIVSVIEADDIELERALALFEEGVGHIRTAERILARTELRVDELLGEGTGALLRPLVTEGE
jgi:exodeoxyribonuclease VII small subunit